MWLTERLAGMANTVTRRMLSGIAVTTCTLVLTNCRLGRAPISDARCTATEAELPIGSNAEALAGAYRVVFVGTEDHAKGKELSASLELYPQDSSRQVSRAFGSINPNFRYPLYGVLHGDLARVGGFVHGRTDSRDPDRPGVMVGRTNAVYDGRAYTRIRLSIGDEGNQRDVIRFDGTSFTMDVAEFDVDGFRGYWSSSVGITTVRGAGYYCAWRVMAPTPR